MASISLIASFDIDTLSDFQLKMSGSTGFTDLHFVYPSRYFAESAWLHILTSEIFSVKTACPTFFPRSMEPRKELEVSPESPKILVCS